MYTPLSKLFKPKELLKADDLNNVIARIERLEKLSVHGLITTVNNDSVCIALPNNIPDIEFILTDEEVTSESDRLFEGTLIDQNSSDEFERLEGQKIQFRNIFGCTIGENKKALVIRFPRGNGDWLFIPKACQ